MVLKAICLSSFRNYDELNLSFDDGINVIYGENGQGKTNLLESIYYLGLTQSFRASNDNECLNYINKIHHFNVSGDFLNRSNYTDNVRVYYSKKEKKHLFVNDVKEKKFKHHVGYIPMVLLKPDDIKLTYGSPSIRRKFIDILISQLSPRYMDDLMRYGRVVKHKNSLYNTQMVDKNQIDIWNEKLIEYGTPIIEKRIDVIKELKVLTNEMYQLISGREEDVDVKYSTFVVDDIKSEFTVKLTEAYDKELRYKNSIIGPHRDDLAFSINSKNVGDYGSQGENKTFLISLKLAELKLLSKYLDEKPILLFDDIFSELDQGRINRLMDYVN